MTWLSPAAAAAQQALRHAAGPTLLSDGVPSPSGSFAAPSPDYYVPTPLPMTSSPNGIDQLIHWMLYGALVCCLLGLVTAAGMAAIGSLASRPQLAVRGRYGVFACLAGAMVVGLAIPVVDAFYTL